MKRKNLDIKYLKKIDACSEGIEWFVNQAEKNIIKVIEKLVAEKKTDWALWLLPRAMTRIDRVEYAVFAAGLVLHIYEKEYPNDKRPRMSIEAAKKYIKSPTGASLYAADAAANAAYAAADAAAYAAYAAADAAANAAYAAANAAADAADAAYAAADAAANAAYAAANAAAYAAADAAYAAANAAADAADAADAAAINTKIITSGIKILKGE